MEGLWRRGVLQWLGVAPHCLLYCTGLAHHSFGRSLEGWLTFQGPREALEQLLPRTCTTQLLHEGEAGRKLDIQFQHKFTVPDGSTTQRCIGQSCCANHALAAVDNRF
jgi:hypothetical protein